MITSNSDLEPLLASDPESQISPTPIAPQSHRPSSIKRLNSVLPNSLNRRQLKLLNQERCGRTRLVVLVIVLFFTIYYAFVTSVKEPKQLLVIIPPDDINLPGPKVSIEIMTNTTTLPPNSTTPSTIVPKGYLVYGPGCRMPDLDPYERDVMKLFTKESLMRCKEKPLTSIQMDYEMNRAYLVVNQTLARSEYLERGQKMIDCCYQNIIRSGVNGTADSQFELSKCAYFTGTVELPSSDDYILVKCKNSFKKNAKVSYTDAHATIRESKPVRKRLEKYKKRDSIRPASVLMIGIDSISRLNLIRAMPKTAQYLYDTGWFELRGYNKIDDNTYPNLMAILVGYNNSLAYTTCNPKEVGKLDNCPFMWKYFQENGYVTGYAEDAANINTFNYNKKGFVKPPTDHYFRPFALAAEKNLPNKLKSSLKFCLGYKTYADYIYQYALDFATTYKNDTSFGLFWTNTFSHNDISDPSSMDEKIKYYIEELEHREILNNSIVIFWSDHGLRFGPVRYLLSGWLEERLPFFFMWLPPWFREQHPDIVQNLKINRNRLTNPYDLHMTLKHILELSGRIDNIPGAKSCPTCQSLFNEIPWNRTCDEIAIEAHWCTCSPYVSIDKNSPIVVEAVKFTLKFINNLLDDMKNGTKPLCAQLKLKSVTFSKQSKLDEVTFPYNDILVMFDTQPGGGKFEATIRYYVHEKRYEITGTISRLNLYGSEGGCVDVDYMKKYCVCLKKKKKH